MRCALGCIFSGHGWQRDFAPSLFSPHLHSPVHRLADSVILIAVTKYTTLPRRLNPSSTAPR